MELTVVHVEKCHIIDIEILFLILVVVSFRGW